MISTYSLLHCVIKKKMEKDTSSISKISTTWKEYELIFHFPFKIVIKITSVNSGLLA